MVEKGKGMGTWGVFEGERHVPRPLSDRLSRGCMKGWNQAQRIVKGLPIQKKARSRYSHGPFATERHGAWIRSPSGQVVDAISVYSTR